MVQVLPVLAGNAVSLLCPFHTKRAMDDPSFAPGIMVFRASLHLAILFTIRHMDGKRANVTVPGYLTHTRTIVSSQCRSLCGLLLSSGVLIEGAAGDAPQTPWTSSGAHVIDRLVTKFACVTMFCIVNRAYEMGLLTGLGLVACAKCAKSADGQTTEKTSSNCKHRKGAIASIPIRTLQGDRDDTNLNASCLRGMGSGLNLTIMIGKGGHQKIALWGDARRVDRMSYGTAHPWWCGRRPAMAHRAAPPGVQNRSRLHASLRDERTETGYSRGRRACNLGIGEPVSPVTVTCAVMLSRLFIRGRPMTFNLRDSVPALAPRLALDGWALALPHSRTTLLTVAAPTSTLPFHSPPHILHKKRISSPSRTTEASKKNCGGVNARPDSENAQLSRVSRGYGCENREGQGEKAK
ncbi:hypothetical protein EDB86DRAFT_2831950 [Lactarius hatsudake]|nr:hypothetical protein EDB86DRAFT_2831950 [Lactarius hatsudake]